MPSKKYFVAIVLSSPVLEKIEEIKMELYRDHALKGALRSPAHITLHRPFEWKQDKEKILFEKLEEFNFESPFQIELQNFSSFEPRVIFVDVKPDLNLAKLHKELSNFMKKELRLFNETEDKRGFHAHVTIAFRDLKKPKFYSLVSEFHNRTFSDTLTVDHFSLLRLDKKWEVIGSFPL